MESCKFIVRDNVVEPPGCFIVPLDFSSTALTTMDMIDRALKLLNALPGDTVELRVVR